MGAHWNDTNYSKAYQLYRRIETVAVQLNKRRSKGHVATREFIAELFDIADQLKVLDKKRR